MKTLPLFLIGLVIGAIVVFGLRAAALDDAPAADADHADHDEHAHPMEPGAPAEPGEPAEAAEPGEPAEPTTDEAKLILRVSPEGDVVFASMVMANGTEHRVAPGGHAPMGDFPARILGRNGSFTAHLHSHGDKIEVTVQDDAGKRIAGSMLATPLGTPPENKICPVMGNEVQPDVSIDYKGRRIGFCCWGCDDAFLADPAKHLAKIDRELAARPKPAADGGAMADGAPENAVCPVMGNPVDPSIFLDYEGRRIGFCCEGCDEVFRKNPAKYLKKVDAELAARKKGDN